MKKKRQKKEKRFELGDGEQHRPKKERPHVAQEFEESQRSALAEEVTRGLLPPIAKRARGLA